MIKTYTAFLEVCEDKRKLYARIPDDHLSLEGAKVYELYKAVHFDACFASNATELLEMLTEDEDVAEAAKWAGSEFRQIRRCLERLAASERPNSTT